MSTTTQSAPEAVALETDPPDFVYHKLCPADEFQQGEGKPFSVEGTHLAVFLYQGR